MGVEFFVKFWWQSILVAVASYLVGAINFAILFSATIKHKDIRKEGSGNAGTTNVFRIFGFGMGALTFLCDALKGVAVCLASKYIFEYTGCSQNFMYFAGFFVVLGHIFPVYHNLRGGKGVATSIGVCFVLQPVYALCCVLPCVAIIFLTDRMSVMSVLFAVFTVVWHWVVLLPEVGWLNCAMISGMFALVLFAHRHNIARLVAGMEMPTGVRKIFFGKKKNEKTFDSGDKNENHVDEEIKNNK